MPLFGAYTGSMGLAIRCIRCGATSVSSLFYLGPEAHVCSVCHAPFELVDPRRDRRDGRERRTDSESAKDRWAEWRTGGDRRQPTLV
jgi:hypothetical protein